MVRGAFIVQTVSLKKQLQSDLTTLLSQITDLPHRHKADTDPQIGAQIENLRLQLKDLFDKQTRHKRKVFVHKF